MDLVGIEPTTSSNHFRQCGVSKKLGVTLNYLRRLCSCGPRSLFIVSTYAYPTRWDRARFQGGGVNDLAVAISAGLAGIPC